MLKSFNLVAGGQQILEARLFSLIIGTRFSHDARKIGIGLKKKATLASGNLLVVCRKTVDNGLAFEYFLDLVGIFTDRTERHHRRDDGNREQGDSDSEQGNHPAATYPFVTFTYLVGHNCSFFG